MIGFFFHVFDALYYSLVKVLPAGEPNLLAQLPVRGVQSPELSSPMVERSPVGLTRLERVTFPLSEGCSNRLSYRPLNNSFQ